MKPGIGTRKPYTGHQRSLVLALDVGTTFSGVSYAILEPGEVPKIHGVTRFPGQEHVAGNSKIPSIMYYDNQGTMKAAGAEADGAAVLAQAEDEGWIKTELFKLRLRPKSMKLKMNGMRLPPLPRNKTAVDVFGDFLSYLFRCTHSFIVDTHANGHAMWRAVEDDVQFVLSHPNGWEGAQQTKMRRAAALGGLIPDTDEGKARIRFVTEGEASLHACVLNGLAADVLSNPSGHGFIVADAGGGTLDISTYSIRAVAPLVIEEIAPPDCVFAGSVFVGRRARTFFEEKLKSSKYGTPDSLDHIAKRFDETTKRLFRDDKELQFVSFGSPLDRDMSVGIRGGQLKLAGMEVAALFEPSIQSAVASIKAQIQASSGQVKSVWLVGGFAASPWLFSQLQERLGPLGVTVSRPDSQTSKAVADGAIGFYCDHHVSARVSKFMYGVEYLRNFDPNDEDHVARKHRLFELPSGPKLLPDAFDCILARGVKVKESTVFSRKYCTEVTSLSTLSVFEVEIWCFRGGDTVPKWIARGTDNFSTLCYVRADLSPLAGSAQPQEGKGGKMYWTIVFSIEIHFGLTEFKARIKWTDNNKVRYGPASIVYNESGHRAVEDDLDSADDDGLSSAPSRSSHHRSSTSSKAPSVPATPRSVSRAGSVAHSARGAPSELPPVVSRSPSDSRTRTSSQSSRSSRPSTHERRQSGYSSRASEPVDSRRTSIIDKVKPGGGGYELDLPSAPPAMTPRDRGINFSTDSRMSTQTNATARLGEALTSVWGASAPSTAASKLQTPIASPRGEAASYFEAAPSQPVAQDLDYMTPAPVSRDLPPPVISKPPSPPVSKSRTPMPASGVATPRAIAPDPAPVDLASVVEAASKPATPPAASKVQTPALSNTATPGATTPRASVVAPAWGASKVATPVGTPKPPAATVPASKVATPRGATPVGPSRAASKATSKASSKAASKAPSKAPTPKIVSRAASPPPEMEPLPEEPAIIEPPPPAPPVVEIPPPAPEPVQPAHTHEDDDAVIPPRPEPEPEPVVEHHAPEHVEPPPVHVGEAPAQTQEPSPPLADGWVDVNQHASGPQSAAPNELGDLWASDTKHDEPGFSDFLTDKSRWDQPNSASPQPSNRQSGIASAGGSAFGLGGLASWGGVAAAKASTAASGWGIGSLTNAFSFGSSQADQTSPPSTELPGSFAPATPGEQLRIEIPMATLDSHTEKPVIPSMPATPATPGSKGSKRKSTTAKKLEEQAAAQKAEEEAARQAEQEAAAHAAQQAEEAAAAAAAAAPAALEEPVPEAPEQPVVHAVHAEPEVPPSLPTEETQESAAEVHENPSDGPVVPPNEGEIPTAGSEVPDTQALAVEIPEGQGADQTETAADDPPKTPGDVPANDGEEDQEEGGDNAPAEEEDDAWFNGKKKKGKKGKNGVAAEDMSRTVSTASAGGTGAKKGGGKGKKKK